MGFFGQEYWSGLPFPSPGNLPNPEIKPVSPPCVCVCVCVHSYDFSSGHVWISRT